MKFKSLKFLIMGLILSVTGIANAGLITTIDAGATNHIFASSVNSGIGPISENGITWTATGRGHYGYDSSWGLNDNGLWNNMNLIGLNTGTGSYSITFDVLVSDVLAFVNYATYAEDNFGQASISVFGIGDVLLESYDLNGLTGGGQNQGWNLGFARDTAEIKTIKFSNAYIVANNLRSYVDTSEPPVDVPEPSTLAIFALGMIGLASRRFKKQS